MVGSEKLYQQASYVNGMPYTLQSDPPVLGGYQTGTYAMAGSMSLQLNVSGQCAAQSVAGEVVMPESDPGPVVECWRVERWAGPELGVDAATGASRQVGFRFT
jgi:hypothetical protein